MSLLTNESGDNQPDVASLPLWDALAPRSWGMNILSLSIIWTLVDHDNNPMIKFDFQKGILACLYIELFDTGPCFLKSIRSRGFCSGYARKILLIPYELVL